MASRDDENFPVRGVMLLDGVSYKKGFEDGLDVALRVLREAGNAALGELFELATRVRLEKAGEILRAINGPLPSGDGAKRR